MGRRDLHCDHFRGPASSPILWRDLLFLHFDGFDVQYVVALDKKTGHTVWKKTRAIDFQTTNGDSKKAYGTPTVITVAGKEQLISSAAMATIAYEPRTGKELWKVYHGGMNTAAPPQYGLGRVFLCPGDGGLGIVAVRPDGSGDVTKTHIDWSTPRGAESNVAAAGGRSALRGRLRRHRLVYRSEDGQAGLVEAARQREQYSASPLYAAGKLYFFSEGGEARRGRGGSFVEGVGGQQTGRRLQGNACHRRQGAVYPHQDAPLPH